MQLVRLCKLPLWSIIGCAGGSVEGTGHGTTRQEVEIEKSRRRARRESIQID